MIRTGQLGGNQAGKGAIRGRSGRQVERLGAIRQAGSFSK